MNDVVPKVKLVNCEGFENHAAVLELKSTMEAKLASETYRYGVGMHETGHYIYFREAGHTKFNFNEARIVCRDGELHPEMASLRSIMDEIDTVKHETREAAAHAYAKALAAGGEFTRYFVPEMHPGDSNDRQLFDMQCEVWRRKRKRLDVDADAYWIEARKAIALRLQDPEFCARAIQECRFVCSQLFPWLAQQNQ
jgi:hypothetical protein